VKISWVSGDHSGRWGVRAVPEAYDAVPHLDTLLMDGSPLQLNHDRLAVAAALTFGRYVSGSLELAKACSPATAAAIARYLAPAHATVTPVTLEPRALPIGAGVCIAADEDDEFVAPKNARGARRVFVLRGLRSDRFAGSLATMESLDIATNAWLHARPGDGALQLRASSVAVAVLYAETLQVDEIAVPPLACQESDVKRVRDLLGSARLGFSVLEGDN
jgi:hypothetical protein